MIPRNSDALAIDPGYARRTGGNACAAGLQGWLDDVWFERPQDGRHNHCDEYGFFDHIVIEQPQQDGRSWAVPPAVLIKLAWDGAALAGIYAGSTGAELHAPTVNDWKGSENKVSMHRRLWKVLNDEERQVLGGPSVWTRIEVAAEKGALCRWSKSGAELYGSWTGHNLLDAACLLMWAYGRLEKVG
jgi:hypothetical protein